MDALTLIRFNILLRSNDRAAIAEFIETHYQLDEDSRDLLSQWEAQALPSFPLSTEDLCSLN